MNKKGPGTIFQAITKFFDNNFSFALWHKLVKFQDQTIFLVSCFSI